MITVEQAEQIIQSVSLPMAIEQVGLQQSLGRVLAENIFADRPFPPFDRVTMDGIAINFASFAQGQRSFKMEASCHAGAPLYHLKGPDKCVEVMTGAIRPEGTDAVIRYEDLEIKVEAGLSTATIVLDELKKGQNLHRKGSDRKAGSLLLEAGQSIGPAEIAILATVGKAKVPCSQLPTVAIISTGDELVEVDKDPELHQIRISNSYMIEAALQNLNIQANRFHLTDNLEELRSKLKVIIEQHDVLILSGGVSMGKADYVPQVLGELGVEERFHKVSQRPGKPLWFGNSKDIVVFALPGNPVSSFASTNRYILPWLSKQLGKKESPKIFAALAKAVSFRPALTYFMQVNTETDPSGKLLAKPIEGHGSGDHANLLYCNGFLEIDARSRNDFEAGEVFPFIPFKSW